jgi:hypothetical protein
MAGEMAANEPQRLPSVFRCEGEQARRLRNSVYPNNFFDGFVPSEAVPEHFTFGVEDDVSKTQLKFAHRMHVKNEQLSKEADDDVLKDRLNAALRGLDDLQLHLRGQKREELESVIFPPASLDLDEATRRLYST